MKICTKCKLEKPLNDFNLGKQYKDGHAYHCKACNRSYCSQWSKINPHSKMKNYLVRAYGITWEQKNGMIAERQGRCDVCKTVPKKTLHVDHCHKTGKVRGLLCNSCNNGLGRLKDSVDILISAAQYLVKAENEQL
jgi:hypothetical protein